MKKSVENFVNKTKKEMTADDIIKNIIIFLVLGLLNGIFSYHLIVFLLLSFLYISFVSVLGGHYMNRKCEWGVSFYFGLEGIGKSALLFMLSYIFLCFKGKKSVWILFIYIFIYIVCSTYFSLRIIKGMKQDLYGKEIKAESKFAWLGAGAGLLLAPAMVSSFNENEAFAFLSFTALFLGVIWTTSSVDFIRAYLQKNSDNI